LAEYSLLYRWRRAENGCATLFISFEKAVGKMAQEFISKWYNEGIETDPPPCLKSKIFYLICRYLFEASRQTRSSH